MKLQPTTLVVIAIMILVAAAPYIFWIFIAPSHFRIPMTLPLGYFVGGVILAAGIVLLNAQIE